MSVGSKNVKKGNTDKNSIWKKYNLHWVIIISIWTFFLTIGISILSEIILSNTSLVFAFTILLIIVTVGVISDMIGIAVTAAVETPFHAMAADKVEGAKCAIRLLKNAGVVSNFCNDVIGDICGIVSGVAGATIILKLQTTIVPRSLMTIVITGFVASLTVGGKAMGKSVGINQAQLIVYKTARVLDFISSKFGVDLIPETNGRK
ncbi:hypothetical protein [Alkaliphilus transvaalensis]|uniref:hypothetical protein n=1 Tax=Alkaliphilus transvaalensis TaxID=114628 RepID=UPI000A6E59AA|nr:hypothetical protein [Alkaliphilus transvaalensis]